MSKSLDKIPDVDIDDRGIFKYILIDMQDYMGRATKIIVRGYRRAQFHSNIYDEVEEQITQQRGMYAECVGGGRMQHNPDERTIKVYGYSERYGKADHQVTVELLKKKYPDYNITWSDGGLY